MIRLILGLMFVLLLTAGFYLLTFIWIGLDMLYRLIKTRKFSATITEIKAKYSY